MSIDHIVATIIMAGVLVSLGYIIAIYTGFRNEGD